MRLGVISDIHGNRDALAVALHMVSDTDRLVFLGDLVGYYPWASECVRMMRSFDVVWVLGNHDKAFLDAYERGSLPEEYRSRYGHAIDVTLKDDGAATEVASVLSEARATLELLIDGVRVRAMHGSPADPVEGRIYPDTIVDSPGYADSGIMLLGHTHHAMQRSVGSCLIVNPGSVGQSRDRSGEACAAVVDTGSRAVELRREIYDVTSARQWAIDNEPNLPYLAEVLSR